MGPLIFFRLKASISIGAGPEARPLLLCDLNVEGRSKSRCLRPKVIVSTRSAMVIISSRVLGSRSSTSLRIDGFRPRRNLSFLTPSERSGISRQSVLNSAAYLRTVTPQQSCCVLNALDVVLHFRELKELVDLEQPCINRGAAVFTAEGLWSWRLGQLAWCLCRRSGRSRQWLLLLVQLLLQLQLLCPGCSELVL